MQNMLRKYLWQYLKCPYGKHSMHHNTTHFVDHKFISQTDIGLQEVVIEWYKKFLFDRSTNVSLIAILQNHSPLIATREQLLKLDAPILEKELDKIKQHLYRSLADTVVWLDMANKNCANTDQRSQKPLAVRPGIDTMYPIGSGWGYTAEAFIDCFQKSMKGVDKTPMIELEGLNTLKPAWMSTPHFLKLKERMKNMTTDMPLSQQAIENNRKHAAEDWHPSTFLAFYMWPLYVPHHSRYAPQHNIVFNNDEDVSKLSDEQRNKTAEIATKGSPDYRFEFFPDPFVS